MNADTPSEGRDPTADRMQTLLAIQTCENDIEDTERQIEEWRKHHRKKIKGTTGSAFLEKRKNALNDRMEELFEEWEESASTDPKYCWMMLLTDEPLRKALTRIYLMERESLMELLKEEPVKAHMNNPDVLRFPAGARHHIK